MVMNLSYLVSLPEWFNPWGWVGIGVIIVILLVILIALIVRSVKKGADEEQEEGEPAMADEEDGEEAESQPVADETESDTEEPEESEAPAKSDDSAAPAKSDKADATSAQQESASDSAPEGAPKATRTPVKTYHISKRKDDNRWQVKAAGGAKAIKLFFTQAEAIDFAKKLAESQEARIVIHKEDGSFRRLNYKKQ